jgi:hypothetical protein
LRTLALFALLMIGGSLPVTAQQATGPLRVHPTNPRYFVDSTGKAVLLGGSHTWINLVDSGTVSPPPAFDYNAYLDFLSSNHHNFFRLWAQSLPKKDYKIQKAMPWYQSPMPWQRTGPGNATDGLPKFDLTKFNQAYFDRLRQRVQLAGARGIYVSVMLFDGYHMVNDRRSDDGYPLTGANNINGVDTGTGNFSQIMSLISANALTVEENYVRKVIDTVNDLPNVLYEIANEPASQSGSWQVHFIDFVHSYEAGKPFQHPVGYTKAWDSAESDDGILYSSRADWVSPGTRYPTNDGTHHVVLNDTDHSYWWQDMGGDSAQTNRAYAWKNFTLGNSALFMDPYLMPWTGAGGQVRNVPTGCAPSGPSCTVLDPRWDSIRKNIGYTIDYSKKVIDLGKMTPQSGLASTGFCLANAAASNAEYIVFAPTGGTFTVNLSATTRTLNVEWLNPANGQISAGTAVAGGTTRSFTPPFSGDAVLYLRDSGATTIPAPTAPTNVRIIQ